MPRRDDLHTILLIGSGPIVIGQACEFDYSGTQACKALREDGYRVVLVNSNPATIMTDPGTADRTYIEPLTVEMLEKVIEIEKRPEIVDLRNRVGDWEADTVTGFCPRAFCASAPSPAIPLRMSVTPAAKYTRTPVPGPIMQPPQSGWHASPPHRQPRPRTEHAARSAG